MPYEEDFEEYPDWEQDYDDDENDYMPRMEPDMYYMQKLRKEIK